MKRILVFVLLTAMILGSSLSQDAWSSGHGVQHRGSGQRPDLPMLRKYLPLVVSAWAPPVSVAILLGSDNKESGLYLDYGGDVDTEAVVAGSPPSEARRTGNGTVLPAWDGNTVEDWYMQFRIDDGVIFAGNPTGRVFVDVEYLDVGSDSFNLQYDATAGGGSGDGRFKDTAIVSKTNTGQFLTARFILCDAYFANRDNGADLRLADGGDGAETIRSVRVILRPPGPAEISVASCGASPWDLIPDSDAIQACIDSACDGDTVTFNGSRGALGYRGYLIDKTVFLVATQSKQHLTFTSADPADHALLQATDGLKGFVVRMIARSRVYNMGDVDDITISHLDIDSNMSGRVCAGPDGSDDGIGDNWGSWLPECSQGGDPWCSPGGLAMTGAMDWSDANQSYQSNPWAWTTGLLVDDVVIANTECGTALGFDGAASTIRNSTIDIAGDHVHAPGCAQVDADEPTGAWSDGITFAGPGHLVTGNTIYDASDVGIVFFGGKGTEISHNTIRARSGNRGMFAGIAVHPWIFGDVSGSRVTDNVVISVASTSCGGIHAGINLGTHMWGAGCVGYAHASAMGNVNSCAAENPPPGGTLCTEGILCQEWGHVAAGRSFRLTGNYVAGAQVNYLIEGMDVMGTLVEQGNTSGSPRVTDWQDDASCSRAGGIDAWGTIDRAAHHPTLPGWTDQRVHCER